MENRNNALHYKMYKSGKSIVYAGLATTAALAGLVLANTNATAVHAATAPATEQTATTSSAASTATSATSAEIASQEAVVNSDSANVVSQEAVVSANKANLDSAINQNSAYANVQAAQSANDAAQSDYRKASDAVQPAWQKAHDANLAVSAAQEWADYWNNGGEKLYNKYQNDLTSAQKDLKDAQALSDGLSDAVTQAQNAYDAAEKNDNISVDTLLKLHDVLNAAKKAYKANQKLITNAQNHINFTNDVLAGKKAHSGQEATDFNYGKKQVDALPSLKKTADELNQAYKDAVQAAKDAADIANAKYQALQQAALDNKLPLDSAMLAQWRSNAAGAQKKIAQDKAAQLYNVKVKEGNTYYSINDLNDQIKTANDNVTKDQKNVESRQGKIAKAKALVDNQADVVKGLQKKADDLQSQLDKDPSNKAIKTQLDLLTGKNGQLTVANIILDGYKGELKKQNGLLKKDEAKLQAAKDTLTKWTNLLSEAKATPEYQKLQSDIEYRQSIVDLGNEGLENFNSAKDAAKKIAPLQDAYNSSVSLLNAYKSQLATAQAKLAAMKGETTPTNPDQPSTPDQPSDKPGQNTGDDTNDNTSDTTNKDNVAPNFTVEKNGNYYVNGKQVTKAAYDAHVAAQSLATVKTSASVKGASAAATANDSKALPQTGNENASAVVALGAVSAMFGLGLAAKKREF